jgi:hypothetical protein
MNCTGCPTADFCTDGAYRLATPLECNTSMSAYYGYTFSIFSLKMLSTLKQFDHWYRRNRGQRKFPIGPINSFLFTALLAVQISLIGVNVLNFENGGSFVLYSLMFLQ